MYLLGKSIQIPQPLKVASNFSLSEFIDPVTYKRFGTASTWFIDPTIVQVAQFIRTRFNKSVTINSWSSKGQYKLSGFRPMTSTIGAKLSQHRFGRAVDIKIADLKAVYEDILKNKYLYHKVGLRAVEDIKYTSTWIHLDCRWLRSDEKEILIVKPKRKL